MILLGKNFLNVICSSIDREYMFENYDIGTIGVSAFLQIV